MTAAPEHGYLEQGLVENGELRRDLEAHSERVAQAWLAARVEPAAVEVASEQVARWALALGEARVDAALLERGLGWLALPAAVRSWMAAAAARPLGAAELAALAVHLVDIVERLALLVFLPELPALTAKADRTGGAARSVGVARYLKG
jgi:hypothetical protein